MRRRGTRLKLLSSMIAVLLVAWSIGTVAAEPAGQSAAGGGVTINMPGDLTGIHHFMIELAEPAAVEVYAEAQAKRAPAAQANQRAKEQAAKNKKAQDQTVQSMAKSKVNAQVVYQVQSAYNGIAVIADAAEVAGLASLPGVKAVHYLPLHERNHATSTPLIGAPEAWESFGLTGEGIKVGVIDTGIDYLHAMFGGNGDYAANDTLVIGDTPGYFPGPKVVGGWDFVGDAYNAGSNNPALRIPQPDPDPMDCAQNLGGGHGTHVAGTVGGYGVNADGTTYTGPYDTAVDLSSMRIAPGVAPGVELYALRVFGCSGSTAMTVAAINWALDPNGDGDFSDRLDVINMSLGSAYGSSDDPSAAAANNAAMAGMIVVASAGNSNDVYYITGSPASATRAISVASSVDSQDMGDGVVINGTIYGASNGQSFNWNNAPSTTAPVVYDPANTTGCSAWAAGSLTGKIVLVDWSLDGGASFPCGSAVRANNATAGNAAGIIMVGAFPWLDTAIAGNAAIPSTFTVAPAGAAIKAALAAGDDVTATLTNAHNASVKITVPERDDMLSTFSSRGPRTRDNILKPDIAAPGQSITSARSGTGDGAYTINGTSMAAPHMAGVMALLRQARPNWSADELKALAMNTANNDLYTGLSRTGLKHSPSRVGAGRVNVASALSSHVIAYSGDVEGAVSISFGSVEVTGAANLTRNLLITNKGSETVTYNVGYTPHSSIPGVSFSFPGGNRVTVRPGQTASLTVRMQANAAKMEYSRDPAYTYVANSQWIPEASGVITLTPASGTALRVPLYATARPAAKTSAKLDAPGLLKVTGSGLNVAATTSPAIQSKVTALELHHVSGLADMTDIAPSARHADLQYVGVATDSQARMAAGDPVSTSWLWFGLATHQDWAVPATELTFYIDIDTNDDGVMDRFIANVNSNDLFYSGLYNAAGTNLAIQWLNGAPGGVPTYLFNSNVMVLPAPSSWLGLPAGQTEFSYRVRAFSRFTGAAIETTPWITYDYANPGISFGTAAGMPTFDAQDGASIPFQLHDADSTMGILLLHHHNAAGSRAQVIDLNAAPGKGPKK